MQLNTFSFNKFQTSWICILPEDIPCTMHGLMSMKNVPCYTLKYVINIVCHTRHRQSCTAWIENYGEKQKAKKKKIDKNVEFFEGESRSITHSWAAAAAVAFVFNITNPANINQAPNHIRQ